MIKIDLNSIKNKITFQDVELTSRSCIGGCACSCGCSCLCSGCGRCCGRFQLDNFNQLLQSIYA